MAATYNIIIDQGADFNLSLVWFNPDGVTPINLTGYSAKAQIKHSSQAHTALLTMSTDDGSIVLGGVAGTILCLISSSITKNINWLNAQWDLTLTSGAGVVTRFVQGTVICNPSITKL